MRGERLNWRQLGELFWSFCKISPMTFGGGYAMLPVIEKEVVERRGWVTCEEMEEAISVAATAPGGIGVNAAAYVGYRMQGWPGIIAAVIGMTLPTFLIVLALGIGFLAFRDHPKVISAFTGIHAAIAALVAYAAWKMSRSAIFDGATLGLLLLSLALLFLGVHPAIVVCFGIGAGIIIIRIKNRFGLPIRYDKHDAAQVRVEQSHRGGTHVPDYFFGEGI